MEIATTAPIDRPSPPGTLQAFVLLAFTVGILALGYRSTGTPATLVIDGQARRLHTQQETVAALLEDMGVELTAEDVVIPDLQRAIYSGMVIRIDRARSVQVSVDGQTATLKTHARAVREVLDQAAVTVNPHDELRVAGDLEANPADGEPVHIIVQRAVPVTLVEGENVTTIYTTASTVGEVLHDAGLTLHLADHVEPAMNTLVSAGMSVVVERSTAVTVRVDGRSVRTRTHRERVGEVLADLEIALTGQDYTEPPVEAPLPDNPTIEVVRVSEGFWIEQEPIPFESIWRADPDLEIDNRRLLQEGAPGVRERRVRVRYENGDEMSRTVENEYVAVPPTTRVQGYGTKILVRTLSTASGPVEYWRKKRMLATSYSAGTAGVPRSSPSFGITATGARMRHGIVAVDPRVISLGSRVYVPGYGVGLAADTGGAIKGNRIDLGFDDTNLELWYRWVDVYLLTPVPPTSRIDYNVP